MQMKRTVCSDDDDLCLKLNHLWWAGLSHSGEALTDNLDRASLKYAHLSGQDLLTTTQQQQHMTQTHAHTHTVNMTGSAGVCLVRGGGTSRDKELVILLFVYVSIAENLTAVILLKQTDGCRESQEKSPSFPSSTHRSIYIPIFHCLLCTVNRRRRKLQFSYIDDNMW